MILKICFRLLFVVSLYSAISYAKQTGGESRFLKDIMDNKLGKTVQVTQKPIFLWDFTGNEQVHTYTYEQEVFSKSKLSHARDGSGMNLSTKATMLVKSQGDGSSDLLIKDMNSTFTIKIDENNKPQTREMSKPPIIIQSMGENGLFSIGDTSEDLLIQLMFVLPSKSLLVGESVDIPRKIRFTAMGSMLQVTGYTRVTLTQYVKIDQKIYAQLNADTNISKLRLPQELKDSYRYSAKGKSVYYFDLTNRSFFSGSIAILISFGALVPKLNASSNKKPEMSMDTDVFIKYLAKD